MEDEAALTIRVLESQIHSYWRSEDRRDRVAKDRHFAYSIFFAELLRCVDAVVEHRSTHSEIASKQLTMNYAVPFPP